MELETINNLREEFWISKTRKFVKGIINKFLVCPKFEGPCYDYPILGPLPDPRANFDFPYSSIGIDYAGPVYVRNIYNTKDNDLYKAWIVLITCCSSRCTYLDIVPDCYGHSCTDILKRFISIHGALKLIISDNGPTFSDEVKPKIQKAPWMGGIFEQIISRTKRCLRKTLGNARVNYQEVLTILKEIENVLNNRPLTTVYYDEILQPLTPNKLLYGHNINTEVTDNQYEDIHEESTQDLTKRFIYMKKLF